VFVMLLVLWALVLILHATSQSASGKRDCFVADVKATAALILFPPCLLRACFPV
jgi:hypothetical protein